MISVYSWGFMTQSFSIKTTGHQINGNLPFTSQATACLSYPGATPTLGILNVTYNDDSRGLS